jgi:hypothetical protein
MPRALFDVTSEERYAYGGARAYKLQAVIRPVRYRLVRPVPSRAPGLAKPAGRAGSKSPVADSDPAVGASPRIRGSGRSTTRARPASAVTGPGVRPEACASLPAACSSKERGRVHRTLVPTTHR